METLTMMEILRRTASGVSRQATSELLGVSKSTVQYTIDRVRTAGLTVEEASLLSSSELEAVIGQKIYVRNGFYEPDFENVYCLNMIHGKNRRSLKQLWQSYREDAPQGSRTLGYKGFCKAYDRFCKNLPDSCRQVQLINRWVYGNVAMIDYSGDGLNITEDGKIVKAQIFVAVLPASGYIFCYATPRQTRDDWLDAQIKMMEFFGEVPREIYLDNSTSLVVKPDKYRPQVSSQYQAFCDYYGTIPVPVRPGAPKDKAAVENAVKQVQTSVLNPLRSRQFFSLEELNRALVKELDKLNHRPLTTRSDGVSRHDLMREERMALLPLPTIAYEISSITKILKVQKSNIVRFNNIRYSIPYGYVGLKVKVIKNGRTGTVNIFDLKDGHLIWTHYPPSGLPQDIILQEHMPERVRSVMRTKEELIELIGRAGPASRALCEILVNQLHGELARKMLRAVNHLRTKAGNSLFETSCRITLQRNCPSYDILCEVVEKVIHGKDKTDQDNVGDGQAAVSSSEVRGSGYYEQLLVEKTKEVS